MNAATRCPVCGTAVSGATSAGMCPVCLLSSGLDDDDPGDSTWSECRPSDTFGDYEIEHPLGAGGMGVVYRARQISLNRPVAIKMIRAARIASSAEVERFRREAESAAKLDHPNIVPAYDAGERDGCHYYVMKFVTGARTLASEIASGPVEPRRAAVIVAAVAGAVHYAHQHGIIHRDIKPANILIDPQGVPHLTDFGLVKLLEADRTLTDGSRLMGTPNYMSPEQVRGRELTTATDVYALGVVLYELLTGRPPFRSKSIPEVLMMIAEVEARPPRVTGRRIDPDLEAICLKCLEKDPRMRYGSADALVGDIERWLRHQPISARRISAAQRVAKWAWRHPAMAVLTSAVFLSAAVALGAIVYILHQEYRATNDKVDMFIAGIRNERLTNKAGRRWSTLEDIRDARRLLFAPMHGLMALASKEDAAERGRRIAQLRNEAVAALEVIDIRPAGEPIPLPLSRPDAVVLSPDFALLAVAGPGGTVDLLPGPAAAGGNPAGGTRRIVLPGISTIRELAFSPDARWLGATGNPADGAPPRAVVCATSDGRPRIERTDVVTSALAFSPDSRRIATGLADRIELHPLGEPGDDGAPAAWSEVPVDATPHSLAFSPDGSLLAVSFFGDDTVRLFNLQGVEPAPAGTLDVPRPRGLDWHPTGRQLAIAGGDAHLHVWSTMAGPREPIRLASNMETPVEKVRWHPRGVLVAGRLDGGQSCLWHISREELEVQWPDTMPDLRFSIDGSRLGLSIRDGAADLLEVAEGLACYHATGHPDINITDQREFAGGTWHPVYGICATAGADGIRIWSERAFELAHIPAAEVKGVVFTLDSLIASGADGIVSRRLGFADGVVRLDPPVTIHPATDVQGLAVDRGVLALPPDPASLRSRWLAAARDGEVLVFDLSSGDPAQPRVLAAPALTAFVDIDRKGEWIAAGTRGGSGVRVWSLPDGKPAADLPIAGSARVVFSPPVGAERTETLVTGDGSGYRFWSIGRWSEHDHEIPANLGTLPGLISFSPRRTALALSHQLNRIEFHDVGGRIELTEPDFDAQFPVCFSEPFGRFIVTADTRRHLHFWDLVKVREELGHLGLDWEFLDAFPDVDALPIPIEVTRVDSEEPEAAR